MPFYQRRSPRLQGYDYSQAGAYFVTLCCYQRLPFFGQIVDGVVNLSPTGEIAAECWLALPEHFPSVDLDAWVIMPNHMHGIIIRDDLLVGTRYSASASPLSLGAIINTYKGAVTRAERLCCNEPELRLWQTRYHDHIIRNEQDLDRIREYIVCNPARWEADAFFT